MGEERYRPVFIRAIISLVTHFPLGLANPTCHFDLAHTHTDTMLKAVKEES